MSARVDACRAVLLAAARSFRLGCDAQGNESFVAFVDRIGALLGELPSDRAERITALFPAILEAQGRGDGITIADLLEHEIGPLL